MLLEIVSNFQSRLNYSTMIWLSVIFALLSFSIAFWTSSFVENLTNPYPLRVDWIFPFDFDKVFETLQQTTFPTWEKNQFKSELSKFTFGNFLMTKFVELSLRIARSVMFGNTQLSMLMSGLKIGNLNFSRIWSLV